MDSPRPSVCDSQSSVSAIQLDALDRRRRSSSSSSGHPVTSLGGERSEKRKLSTNMAPYFQMSSRKTSGAPKPVHQDYADHSGNQVTYILALGKRTFKNIKVYHPGRRGQVKEVKRPSRVIFLI